MNNDGGAYYVKWRGSWDELAISCDFVAEIHHLVSISELLPKWLENCSQGHHILLGLFPVSLGLALGVCCLVPLALYPLGL